MRQNEPVPVRAGGGSRQILDSCVARTSIAHPLFTFTCCPPACHSQCHEPVVPHRSGPQDRPKAEPGGAQRVVCKEEGAQPEQHILKGARGLMKGRGVYILAGNAPSTVSVSRENNADGLAVHGSAERPCPVLATSTHISMRLLPPVPRPAGYEVLAGPVPGQSRPQ